MGDIAPNVGNIRMQCYSLWSPLMYGDLWALMREAFGPPSQSSRPTNTHLYYFTTSEWSPIDPDPEAGFSVQ